MNMNARSAVILMPLCFLPLMLPGCAGRSQINANTASSEPAAVQEHDTGADQVTVTIADLEPYEPAEPEARWLAVERIAEGADGAWATGGLVSANKIVIETENVAQFRLDLDQIPVDWSRRVVLRIDGRPSELTREHYPTLRLRRSPTGGWLPVESDETERP